MNKTYSGSAPVIAGLTNLVPENNIENNFWQGEEKMTLITAMKVGGGIIMAADSRSIGPGGAVNDQADKLVKFQDCLIGISGSGEIGLGFLWANREKIEKSKSPIDIRAEELSKILAESYTDWIQKMRVSQPNMQPPFMGFILSGFRAGEGGQKDPVIYSLVSPLGFVPTLSGKGYEFLGIDLCASYLCSRHYTQSLSKDDAIFLSTILICETASIAPAVGGKISVVEFMANHEPKEIENDQIARIIDANAKFNKDIFQDFDKAKSSLIPQR